MNLLNPPRLDKSAVKHSFNRYADQYDRCAVLQAEVQSRLLERLDYINLDARLVVDLGCGTGQAIKPLLRRFKKANVLAFDMAHAMLSESQKKYGLFDKKWLVNADMDQLPLADDSVDLFFSSLALQWSNDLQSTFEEFRRAGRPGGLLMFTTFGINTLSELRESWSDVDDRPRVHQFMDMHDIGDLMVASGLAEPVIDVDNITLEYADFKHLLQDLKAIGATNAEKNRSRGLMTARKLDRLEQAYRQRSFRDGRYLATYEVVYGHAWY